MSTVFILTTDYDEHKEYVSGARYTTEFAIHPVFRIRKCVSEYLI